ncbi:MAG: MBL fold metallo-hydrolase [Clostridia bacterium]|nr:MBL fold metallo-hydrolase [Clostridia bacterium]MDD4386712.1 MBL fold metallo-hydrolase [Clostridia bacterium]
MFYLEDNDTSILIDVGVSFKSVCLALESIGKSINDIDAILITHEHIDHIRSLPLICKNYNIPVYTCLKTKEYLEEFLVIKKTTGIIHSLEYDKMFKINNLEITPFETSHDAIMPCGFYISNTIQSLAFATDLGYVSDTILNYLSKANYIVLESNYDNIMLEYGKYPFNIKRRIASDIGHLSNKDTAGILTSILSISPNKKFLLSHLSANNNTIDIACDTITSHLKENGLDKFDISFASKDLSCEGYII